MKEKFQDVMISKMDPDDLDKLVQKKKLEHCPPTMRISKHSDPFDKLEQDGVHNHDVWQKMSDETIKVDDDDGHHPEEKQIEVKGESMTDTGTEKYSLSQTPEIIGDPTMYISPPHAKDGTNPSTRANRAKSQTILAKDRANIAKPQVKPEATELKIGPFWNDRTG